MASYDSTSTQRRPGVTVSALAPPRVWCITRAPQDRGGRNSLIASTVSSCDRRGPPGLPDVYNILREAALLAGRVGVAYRRRRHYFTNRVRIAKDRKISGDHNSHSYSMRSPRAGSNISKFRVGLPQHIIYRLMSRVILSTLRTLLNVVSVAERGHTKHVLHVDGEQHGTGYPLRRDVKSVKERLRSRTVHRPWARSREREGVAAHCYQPVDGGDDLESQSITI